MNNVRNVESNREHDFICDIASECDRLLTLGVKRDMGTAFKIYHKAYDEHLKEHGSFKKYLGMNGKYAWKMNERVQYQQSKVMDYLYFGDNGK